MIFKSTKRFLNKNNLLQKDLLTFLRWQELKQNNLLREGKTLNKKEKPASNCLTKDREALSLKKKRILRNFYRSNQTSVFDFSLEQNQKTLIFGEFFPQKKSFFNFWVFPLLGGCFLSLLTLSQNQNFKTQKFGFPNFDTASKFNVFFEKKELRNAFLNQKSSKMHQKDWIGKFNQKGAFVAFYDQSKNAPFWLNGSLSSDLENLCRFYIGLTHQNLKLQNKEADSIDKSWLILLDRAITQNPLLKNVRNFHVFWHALQTEPANSFIDDSIKNYSRISEKFHPNEIESFISDSSLENFPDKIKNENFSLSLHNKKSLYVFEISNTQDIKIPHVSYLEASKLMDSWITELIKKKLKRNEKTIENPKFEIYDNIFQENEENEPNILKAINTFKGLIANQSEFKQKKYLTFHVFEFFNSCQKNQKLLRKFSSIFDFVPANKSLIQDMDSLIKTSQWNTFSIKDFNSSKAFLKNMQSSHKYNLFKDLLTNYLYGELKSFEKAKYLKRVFFDKNPPIFLSSEKNESNNAFIQLNPLKKIRVFEDHDFENFSNVRKKHPIFKFNNCEMRNILDSTVFVRFFQKKSLLENKTEKILKNSQSLSLLNIIEDLRLKSIKVDVQKLSYELILLNAWKNLISNIVDVNYECALKNLKVSENKKQKTVSASQNQLFLMEKELNEKPDYSRNFFDQKLFTEVHLYKRLDQISKALLEIMFPFDSKNETNAILYGNPSIKTQQVLKYKTPILSGKVSFLNTSILRDLRNSKAYYDIKSAPTSFKNLTKNLTKEIMIKSHESWQELAPKQNEIQNLFVFRERPLINSQNCLSFFSKISKILGKLHSEYIIADRINQVFSFSNKFDQQQVKNYLEKIEFQKIQPNSFFFIKEFKDSKTKRVFLLEISDRKYFSSSKTGFKSFRKKSTADYKLTIPRFKKRKIEKIFRAYLSTKYSANEQKKKLRCFSILPVLKKWKKVLKVKKKNKLNFHLSGKNLWTISKLKNPNADYQHLQKNTFSNLVFEDNRNIQLKNSRKTEKKQLYVKSEQFLKKFVGYTHFFKKKECQLKDSQINRFVKKQVLQKKRRLKKLRLENRRRKKRKRFYPRPHFLRFELYNSFLQRRHSKKSVKNSEKNQKADILIRKQNDFDFKKQFRKKIFSQKIEADFVKNKIFRQKRQKWGNLSSQLFFSEKQQLKKSTFDWTNPTYHQKEFYKISNETLTDFERLCWKSYWLRSNLKPYIRRIQENWKKMKEVETLKTSRDTFVSLLKDLLIYPFPKNREAQLIENSSRFCLQQADRRTASYFNVKDALDWSKIIHPKLSSFKTLENMAEYDRLLYERITEEIKNVKAQLNIHGQKQARSYKLGRQKIDRQKTRNSFYSLIFSGPRFLDPKVTTLTNSKIGPHSSIKPFGDLPTLRLLWACNKTNSWTFKETNFARQLWSRYKNREQIKNNKTKKFIKKVWKFYGWDQKDIDKISFNKLNQNCKKIHALGGHVFEKNSRFYLQNLKLQFHKPSLLQKNLRYYSEQEKSKNPISEVKLRLLNKVNKDKKAWFEKGLELRSQKRRIHFWWSIHQNNPIERTFYFWFLSAKNSLNLNKFVQTNKNLFIETNNKFNDKELKSPILNSGFWICCLLFHISIFFGIARIPTIRSLFKFQFLLISKLVNVYLIGLWTLYDLIKDFKKTIEYLLLKFRSLTRKKLSLPILADSNINQRVEVEQPFGFLNQKYFRFQNSMRYRSTLNSLKFSKYLVSEQRQKLNESLSSSNSIQSLSFQIWPDLTKKKERALDKKSLRLSSSDIVQSTISFRVLFRDFMNFSPGIQDSSGTLLSLKNIISYSIAPSFGPVNYSKSRLWYTNNWLYSWYTGFLWNLASKSNQKLLKSEKYPRRELIFKNKKRPFFEEFKSSFLFTKDQNKIVKQKIMTRSMVVESNIQVQSTLALLTLFVTKSFMNVFYYCFSLFYKVIFKTIDILEIILLIFYKFFEKPAEVVVEWIADIFLVEWSSDITSFMPEAFDTALWQSTTKFSRSMQVSNGPMLGFFVQKMFLSCLENIYSSILRPEADLIVRQKKGLVFWDIWAEILIQAAEQYKMNLSSLSTIKEEQELLIQNILEETEPGSKKEQSLAKVKNFKNPMFSTNFFNSEILNLSLVKLRPLTKTLHCFPSDFLNQKSFLLDLNSNETSNNPYKFYDREITILNSVFVKKNKFTNEFESLESFNKTILSNSWKRWSVNQFLTTQGRDTDLFMDVHPSTSFSNFKFLKSYSSAQEIFGSVICDVYSGLFNKKVSKNILIVGAPGAAKTVFVRALAGETELKIVTENSKRYAIVQGGIPIGMKLLRDVFDSIAMHTPCLFLLEDIHRIGERRPMLISDNENSKANDTSFGAEQEEVHEKNKLIYQSSRHAISHYKKPYKADFSISSPTNYYCYDFFLGLPASRKRVFQLTTRSPFSVLQLENAMEAKYSSSVTSGNRQPSKAKAFFSLLEIGAEQIFAPPATSPFTILLMKEQKKLKPKKLVNQLPWSGISYDQLMLISKSNYEVRSKVALLAEIAMNNLSIKLDMITDLLVIIDSVRSNRGFVVFATTHLPSLLDPALRRPGRLDETLSLPFLPNLSGRFEVLKTSLSSCQQNVDILDYSLFAGTLKQNENEISSTVSNALLLLFNTKGSKKSIALNSLIKANDFSPKNAFLDFPIYSLSQALRATLKIDFIGFDSKKSRKIFKPLLNKKFENSKKSSSLKFDEKSDFDLFLLLNSNNLSVSFSGHDRCHFVAYAYGQAGQFLTESLIVKDQTTYTRKIFKDNLTQVQSQKDENILKILYSSKIQANVLLFKLFAGKFSEFFALNNDFYNSFSRFQGSRVNAKRSKTSTSLRSANETSTFMSIENKISKQLKEHILKKHEWWLGKNSLLQVNPAQSSLSDNVRHFQNYWQSATTFIESLIQKRYLTTKNSVVSKLLLFEDRMGLRDSLSPPNSLILTPARKFESYKRTLRDFIQKPILTINEKLQMHQKQRFLKLLYQVPVQTSLRNVSNYKKNLSATDSFNKTTYDFYNSFKELSYLDICTLKPTSTFYFYKNEVLIRHRFSFVNQWWNGQLAEHNVETTYLSHVDWRSMFIESLGDVSLDFPDAEQFYNPKSRRWFLHSKAWEYWRNFEKISKSAIAQHYIFSCFTTLSSHLNINREFFDYLAFRLLRYHNLQEIDLVNFSVRFYKTDQMLIS